jgi:hypothetical protein
MGAASLVLLAVLAQLSPPTAGPQAKAKAQELLNEGWGLYEKGDYAGALERFNGAYAAYPSPKLMFNIGQANRDLSRPVEALAAFEKFLADDTEPSSETTADARQLVAELQGKLGRILIQCETTDADVSVDGKSVGRAPLAEPIWATPGHHQVTASHARAALAIEDVNVTAGSVHTVILQLHPLAVPAIATPVPQPEAATASDSSNPDLLASPAPSAASKGWWLGRKWTWVAAGSTALLAAGAVIAGVAMQSRFDSLDKSCGGGNPSGPGCSESDISSVRSREITANVFWGLAGAAAVTTGVLFYVEGRAVRVSPVAGGTTGFIAAVRY